jgi:hypothetical protein
MITLIVIVTIGLETINYPFTSPKSDEGGTMQSNRRKQREQRLGIQYGPIFIVSEFITEW